MNTNTQAANKRGHLSLVHLNIYDAPGLSLPVFLTALENRIVKVSFLQSPFIFVYIKYNSAEELEKYLMQGVKYFLRDLERNPCRRAKHSIIFNA